jgi:hypothetical protein
VRIPNATVGEVKKSGEVKPERPTNETGPCPEFRSSQVDAIGRTRDVGPCREQNSGEMRRSAWLWAAIELPD